MLTPQEIASEVIRRIEEYPETHNQTVWFRSFDNCPVGTIRVDGIRHAPPIETWGGCGTSACVAGHAVIVALEAGMEVVDASIEVAAANLLGLTFIDQQRDIFSAVTRRDKVLELLHEIASCEELDPQYQ